MMEAGKRCALLVGGVLLLAACSRESKPTPVPAIPPPEPASTLAPAAGTRTAGPRCAENFKLFDANHDGEVSKSEFMAHPHWQSDPDKIFTGRDRNADAVLTETEFCSGPRGGRGMGPAR